RPSSTRLPEAKAGSSVRTPAILERLYGTGVVLPTPFSPESEFCAVLMNGKSIYFQRVRHPKFLTMASGPTNSVQCFSRQATPPLWGISAAYEFVTARSGKGSEQSPYSRVQNTENLKVP